MAWNQSSETPSGKSPTRATKADSPRRPYRRGILAGLIVVIGAVVVWIVFTRGQVSPQESMKSEPKPQAPLASASAPTNRPVRAKVEIPVASDVIDGEKWDDSFVKIPEKRYKFSKLASATTNDRGVVNERWRMPNGKFWRRQIDPPPLFNNASDNAIAVAISSRSGAPIPPYPGFDDRNLDREFANSLLTPIVIKEDDRPWLVALKMSVKETREEIARMIKAGDKRSVGEILRDHVDQNNRTSELKGEALKGYYKTLKEDGPDAAGEYLEKVNKALEGFGVTPIKSNSQRTERKRKL